MICQLARRVVRTASDWCSWFCGNLLFGQKGGRDPTSYEFLVRRLEFMARRYFLKVLNSQLLSDSEIGIENQTSE